MIMMRELTLKFSNSLNFSKIGLFFGWETNQLLELYSITKFEINNFGFHNSSFSPSLKIFISKLHAGFVHTLIKFLVCKTVRYPCIIYSIIHEGN